MAVIEAIATTYLEADASSVTFSSLGSYEHLQLRMSAKSTDTSAEVDWPVLTFNADTGNNYSFHYLYGTSNLKGAGRVASQVLKLYRITTAKASVNSLLYGRICLDIFDYRNANKNTTIQSIGAGPESSPYLNINFQSGLWDDTAAVTSIALTLASGDDYARGSEFSLYGIQE
jgi:hypothetical protein